MALEDPFFMVKDEVNKAVESSKTLYRRWCELQTQRGNAIREEFDWTTKELQSTLRSIEWDLQDLEETIGVVEKAPERFTISEAELKNRKNFITKTRDAVKEISDHLNDPLRNTPPTADIDPKQALLRNADKSTYRYTRLQEEMEKDNQKFIDETQEKQQLMMKEQDSNIEKIGGTVSMLKNISYKISDELDDQDVLLDDLNRDLDRTDNRIDSVMKKMAKVMHMSTDRRQWCAIGVLLVILLFILVLFAVL